MTFICSPEAAAGVQGYSSTAPAARRDPAILFDKSISIMGDVSRRFYDNSPEGAEGVGGALGRRRESGEIFILKAYWETCRRAKFMKKGSLSLQGVHFPPAAEKWLYFCGDK